MLDERQKTILKHIRDKAIEHAEKCVERFHSGLLLL